MLKDLTVECHCHYLQKFLKQNNVDMTLNMRK